MEGLSRHGKVCGISLPAGFENPNGWPEAFSPPSTKPRGHDENISFDEAVARIGGVLGELVRAVSLEITSAPQLTPSLAELFCGHKF